MDPGRGSHSARRTWCDRRLREMVAAVTAFGRPAPSGSKPPPGHHGDTGALALPPPVWSGLRRSALVPLVAYDPVEPDLVGVAILSANLPGFPALQYHPQDASRGHAAWLHPLRQVVSRRVAAWALLVGDAAGYEDALTGEGISLAVAGRRGGERHRRHTSTHRRRMRPRGTGITVTIVTRGLALASTPRAARRHQPLNAGARKRTKTRRA